MGIPKKIYRYRVEYVRHGKWVPAVHTDNEDRDTFAFVANADGYRVLCDGEDITHRYRK